MLLDNDIDEVQEQFTFRYNVHVVDSKSGNPSMTLSSYNSCNRTFQGLKLIIILYYVHVANMLMIDDNGFKILKL